MPSPSTSSKLRRVFSRGTTFAATLGVVGIAVGLVVVVSGTLSDRAAAATGPEPMPPVPVQVAELKKETGYAVPRTFVGQVEPRQTVNLGFEAGGTVSAVMVDEGDVVSAGQVLARLDTRDLEAEKAALEAAREALVAQARLAELTAERQEELRQRGFASEQRFDEATLGLASLRADIARIDANLTGIAVRLDKAVLRAPFAASIGGRLADTGQTTAPGIPALALFEAVSPRFRVGVPPRLAMDLDGTQPVQIAIGGRHYTAVLEQLRPDIDPVTRTQVAVFEVTDQITDGSLLYGQTGEITIVQDVMADGFWVPAGALVEGLSGTWSLFGVNAAGLVVRHAVEVLHREAEEVFVRGSLETGSQIVAEGPHRVVAGQPVAIIGE